MPQAVRAGVPVRSTQVRKATEDPRQRGGRRRARAALAAAALTGALGSCAGALTGCAHYEPRPLTPEAGLARLESRKLDDPELARFLKAQAGSPEWPPRAWGLEALTLVAFYYHPDLELARASWAAARAGLVAAGERPNPGLSVEPGYNSTTPTSQITPWILTTALDLTLETGGKRGHRVAAARQLSEAARLDLASAAWQVRSRVRRALLELHAASGSAALLERQNEIQQANVALLERQLAAGAISRFQLTQARLLLDTARLGLGEAQRRRAEARVQLASALGVTRGALEGVSLVFDDFERLPQELPAPDARRRALLNRVDLLAALAAYEAAQANLQLEIAKQYPDFHLGPGWQLDQAENKWTLGLSGLLPVFSRNRGGIAEAEARRAEAAARVTLAQQRAIDDVDLALAAYESARARTATVDALLADLGRERQSAEAMWRAGEISRLDLGSVQLEIASSEQARFEAVVKTQEALGRLEDAMQSPAVLPSWLGAGPGTTAGTTPGGGQR